MKRFLLNPYQHRSSWLHRMPAGWKLLVAVAFVVALALAPRGAWRFYGASGAALVVLAAMSRVSAFQLIKRVLCFEPFALGAALLALPQPNGGMIFCALLLKSTLCLCCMVLLSSTTRFSEILGALRRARVPSLLITTLALMHRYLFVLTEEMGRLSRARKSRTFARGRMPAWRSSATVIALLFVRASERSERIYDAMCARGWKT